MWRLCYEGSTLEKRTLLKKFFGHSAFRGGQEALIDAILSDRDVLGVMPTGGGKSICYQIPALMLPGLTIVVSPLISLMKDQVAALTEAGVPAAFLNSSLSLEQLRETYAKTAREQYKLLYVAPERLENESFLSLISHVPVSLLAVDEAHCISQWGQDFRPSYLKIADFIAQLPTRPVVAAFTATATKQVRADIISQLGLRNPLLNITGFDRPNLYFAVQHPTSKLAAVWQLVRERSEKSGIVYCNTRASVERVCEFLNDKGIAATRYHAGLSEEERHANQDDFRFDRKTVMVATNAFGMGIDKSNVSFVIHYNMPKSLEAYYQEAGRAGRDGSCGECILLYAPGDVQTARFLIQNGGNEELDPDVQEHVREGELQRLRQMTGYCKTTDCLRGYILSYFGQSHPESCGCCGNCKTGRRMQDVTVPAQMLLSCVYRIYEKLGYFVGKTMVLRVLRGSRDKRVLDLGLDQISTYNLMHEKRQELNALCDFLEAEGYLRVNPEHSTLEPEEKVRDVLFRGKQLLMPVLDTPEPAPKVSRKDAKKQTASLPSGADDLFGVLRETRMKIAQRENVPAYIVCSNSTLLDMAEKAPETMDALLAVSGIGEVKACRYGEDFLSAIRNYQRGK